MRNRYKLFALLLVVLVSFSFYSFNVQRYMAPPSAFSNPVEEDHDVFSLNMWPQGTSGACIITLDHISATTPVEDLWLIDAVLQEYGAHATFFVIPSLDGEWDHITDNDDIIDVLNQLVDKGHEVALHGYSHSPSQELRGKDKQEQTELIRSGKRMLTDAIGPVYGFRPPSFWDNTDTQEVLEELGFEYNAGASLFNVYPYHPKDLFNPFFGDVIDIIEVPCFPIDYLSHITSVSYSEQLYKLEARFEGCYRKGTPFVLFTHVPSLMEKDGHTRRHEGLLLLDSYLGYAEEQNVWMPTMLEFVRWWEFITQVKVDYHTSSDNLVISVISDDIIDGLTFNLDLPDDINDVTVYVNNEIAYTQQDIAHDARIVI
jgi:peptidoglycan/xylan/chitin deacetylase (PgdA/CDA1 family)